MKKLRNVLIIMFIIWFLLAVLRFGRFTVIALIGGMLGSLLINFIRGVFHDKNE